MIKGNLKYPTFPILINTASVNAFNAYYDTVEAQIKLMFPTSGMIMGGTGTTRTLNLSKTYAGSKQLKEIVLNPAYPGETLNYEAGFDIKVKQRDPGVYNDDFYPQTYHVSAKLPSLGTAQSGGILAVADIVSVKEQLWESAKLSATEGAFNVYMSSDVSGSDTIANITKVTLNFTDGTSVESGALTSTTVAKINADATIATYGYAMLTSATTLKFVFTNQTKCVDNVVLAGITKTLNTNIVIASTDPMKQAFVEVGNDLGTVTGFSYAIIKQTGTGYSRVRIVSTDSSNASQTHFGTTSVDVAGEISAVNASFTTDSYGYATLFKTGEELYILYTLNSLFVDVYPFPSVAGSITATGTVVYSSKGIYPRMTGDDVWRIFTNNAHDGEFANQHYVEKPSTTSEYILVHLVNNSVIGGQHQASSYSGNQQEIRAYVKADQFFTLVYGTDVVNNSLVPLVVGTSNSMCSLLEQLADSNTYISVSGLTETILDLQTYS